MSQKPRHAPADVSECDVLPDISGSYQSPFSPQAELDERQRLIEEIKETADKLAAQDATQGDLKIISRALKELRYSFKVFTPFRKNRKVTVFGSARSESDDPNYQLAVEFGRQIAQEGWYVVTGAGPGIMQAANEGAGREQSMGLNILLPFEQEANPVLEGHPHLINLKYFFTRKLMFVKEVHAIVMFPGGFGTLDECFEVLTLVQTGKRDLMPIVLVETEESGYWETFQKFIESDLLETGMISAEDTCLYRICHSAEDAVEEVLQFYSVYHSMRYVKGKLVIRLHHEPDQKFVDRLNKEFHSLCSNGAIEKTTCHPEEWGDEHLRHLPRLILEFNRKDMGRLREMVDLINRELSPKDS